MIVVMETQGTVLFHHYLYITGCFHHTNFILCVRATALEAQQLPLSAKPISLYLPILLVEEWVNFFILWDVDLFSLHCKVLRMSKHSVCSLPLPMKWCLFSSSPNEMKVYQTCDFHLIFSKGTILIDCMVLVIHQFHLLKFCDLYCSVLCCVKQAVKYVSRLVTEFI